MPNRHPEAVHAERRLQVARLYYRGGLSQQKIAKRVKVTQQQVSLDLAAVREQWKQQMGEKLDELKVEQLIKLDMIEAESLRGWRRSLRDAERKRAKIVNAEGEARQETEKTSEGQSGDPRFLNEARQCVADRRKMLGMDAPQKIAPTTPDGKTPLTPILRIMGTSEPVSVNGHH
jgi:transposase-like protein